MSNTYRLLVPHLPKINQLYSDKEHSIIFTHKIKHYYCLTKSTINLYVQIDNCNKIIIEIHHSSIKPLELGTEMCNEDCNYFLRTFPFPLNKEWNFLQGFRGFYYQHTNNEAALYWNETTNLLLLNWIQQRNITIINI